MLNVTCTALKVSFILQHYLHAFFPSGYKFKKFLLGWKWALMFATITKQPFLLPHYCKISSLPGVSPATQDQFIHSCWIRTHFWYAGPTSSIIIIIMDGSSVTFKLFAICQHGCNGIMWLAERFWLELALQYQHHCCCVAVLFHGWSCIQYSNKWRVHIVYVNNVYTVTSMFLGSTRKVSLHLPTPSHQSSHGHVACHIGQSWTTHQSLIGNHIHTYVRTSIHTYEYVHTYICTYIHPYIHTYIHIVHCWTVVSLHRTLLNSCQSASYTAEQLSVCIVHCWTAVGPHRTLLNSCQSASHTAEQLSVCIVHCWTAVSPHRTLLNSCQSASYTAEQLSVCNVHCWTAVSLHRTLLNSCQPVNMNCWQLGHKHGIFSLY